MRRISTHIDDKKSKFKDLSGYFQKVLQLKRLEKYIPIIDMVLTEYDKKSCDETMMIKSYRKSSQDTTNRKTHMENQSRLAVEISRKLGLNEKIVGVMASHHDIGHTFLGHSGEWWLSDIKEDYGIGYYCHNALGARGLIYSKDVYTEILEKIKHRNPNISTRQLKKVEKSLWLIMDAINSHNGERADKQCIPNFRKMEEDFEKELLGCHTKKKFDKGIEPATSEAALMKICDKISYIPSDMVDGIREGFINRLDEEYMQILTSIGITREEIELATKSDNYDSIAVRLKDIFSKDLIQNSTKKKIKMSEEMTRLMYKLLDKNNREIVNFVLMEEDLEIYPAAIRTIVERYSEEILNRNLVDKIRNRDIDELEQDIKNTRGTTKQGFWKHLYGISQKDLDFTTRMVEEATKQSINDELEIAQRVVRGQKRYQPDSEFENKSERIRRYILYFQNKLKKGNYGQKEQDEDAQRLFRKIKEGNLVEPQVGMNKRIALELASQYIATLSDSEFMQVLREEEIITDEQYVSLTRKYKDIDIRKEAKMQSNWTPIQEAHSDAAKEEISK